MTTLQNKLVVLSLYTLILVCMGFATILEKLYGSDYAQDNIYCSWWFIGLWIVLLLSSILFLTRKNVHKRFAVMLLHVSFVVILTGAMVTHMWAEEGTVHLRKSVPASQFSDDEGNQHHLPFTMTLTDFIVENYPGTNAVMDYCCSIDILSENSLRHMSISMNNIGKVQGYRFYQSAYDEDCTGTVLLVAHDPWGIGITYLGYVLLVVGLIAIFFSKHTQIKKLYRKATRALAVVVLLGCSTAAVFAEERTAPVVFGEERITKVNKEIADEIGEVVVLYNGRICPLNTVAIEFVTKLCGKSSWKGYSANEIFVGWMIFYSEWEKQKIIKIKSEAIQHILGIEGSWASVNDFYSSVHEYKLAGKTNDLGLSANLRKSVREADEKMQVVTMFYNNEMLRLFPLNVEGKTAWYSPGSTELPLGTPEPEFQFINHAMDYLTQSILVDDVDGAKNMIRKIKSYQKEKAGDVLPQPYSIKIEIVYNKLQQMRWPVFLCLTLSLLFCFVSLAGKGGKIIAIVHGLYIIVSFFWIMLLLALRWIVSRHVPLSNGFETMLFMAWVMLAITLLAERKVPVIKALGPVVSALCMLVAMIALGTPQITNLMPVLQSPLLTIHVALVMVSYALFALITLLAVYGLYLGRRKQPNAEFERITALSCLLLYPAVAALAIGIFVGAVWANISWGTYWSWDPKETWALITLMIYAIPLHRSFMPAQQKNVHLYLLLAFLTVLMTYFGVNYFLPGMHSYA